MYDIKIFADGASANNQDKDNRVGGTGVVIFIKDTSKEKDNVFKKEFSNKYPGMTNNAAELTAIKEGLEAITPEFRQESIITVISDSKTAIDTFNLWIEDWKSRGWKKKSSKSTPENLDLLKDIWEVLKPQFQKVTFVHIKNDKKNNTDPMHKWNNRSDELAHTAAGSTTR